MHTIRVVAASEFCYTFKFLEVSFVNAYSITSFKLTTKMYTMHKIVRIFCAFYTYDMQYA